MRHILLKLTCPIRFFAILATAGFVGILGTSCNKDDPNAERSEFIKVYDSLEEGEEPGTFFCIGVREGTYPLILETNIPVEKLHFEWQDGDETPWGKVAGVESLGKEGLYSVNLTVKARSTYAYYTRRTGTLMISCPELDYGSFVTVAQGSIARFSNNCSNFKYGVANPLFMESDRIYSEWSAAQKEYFQTEPFKGGEVSYVYGRNTNLRLGDAEGHGGCIVTPFTDELRADSLLMVSFRAVAYADAKVSDANKVTVEILGGGIFRDTPEAGATKMELTVPHFNINSPDFPDDMWNDAEFMVFIQSSEQNPITANTQIRITSGSLSEQADTGCRVFISNVYIRRLVEDVDEDYFTENGGSGVDCILGLSSSDDPANSIE